MRTVLICIPALYYIAYSVTQLQTRTFRAKKRKVSRNSRQKYSKNGKIEKEKERNNTTKLNILSGYYFESVSSFPYYSVKKKRYNER